MAGASPGPWEADGLTVYYRFSDGVRGQVGFAFGPAMPEDSEVGRRCLANARLMAAAPDLLKLAVNILQAKKDGTWESDQEWFVEHATAAIAKATRAQEV